MFMIESNAKNRLVARNPAGPKAANQEKHRVIKNKERAGDEFDRGVLGGDGRVTIAASASQHEPAEDGDVVVPRQIGFAFGASRAQPAWEFAARQTPHDHVQKTPDARAQDEEKDDEGDVDGQE